MVIDLHNHTSIYSPCSIISPDKLVQCAVDSGLDGIAITEHDILWPIEKQAELQERFAGNITLFFGVELNMDIGHVLAFGLDDMSGISYSWQDTFENLERDSVALVWAHPFRWGLNRNLQPDDPLFSMFDAIEYYNGNLSINDNRVTETVLGNAGYRLTGGSDTHSSEMAGLFATRFYEPVNNSEDLVEQLKHGVYAPVIR
jgi:predicted metal-dependent phosphoesterase TrpH